ncbi:protein BOLA2-like [Arachis duranensis]|uniref:Protein BOLA2-like n=1 Tax=Arachis duranensis TaxID=130453 RepID=A0A9C6WMQ7_ARADU|nr:protein BOLA2-like [Arachis duranensis]
MSFDTLNALGYDYTYLVDVIGYLAEIESKKTLEKDSKFTKYNVIELEIDDGVNSYCLCPWCHCRVNARVSLNLKCKKLQVESCLKSKLNPTHLEVVDTSGGCGASFVVEIVSEEFEGKRLLERHRMVNAALEEEMKEIHALSVKKAVTPEQWK